MLTSKYNLHVQAGESVNRQFKLFTGTGDPFDLTGYQLASQVRTEYNSPSVSAAFAVTSSTEPGLLIMSMDASSSAALTGSCYYYDVRMTSGSIVVYPFEGKLVVSPRVTR